MQAIRTEDVQHPARQSCGCTVSMCGPIACVPQPLEFTKSFQGRHRFGTQPIGNSTRLNGELHPRSPLAQLHADASVGCARMHALHNNYLTSLAVCESKGVVVAGGLRNHVSLLHVQVGYVIASPV